MPYNQHYKENVVFLYSADYQTVKFANLTLF